MTTPLVDRLSPLSLMNVVLRRPHIIVRSALAALLVTATFILARPKHYTSTSSFVAQARRTPSALANIAPQLGLLAGINDASQSPAFYEDLIKSRSILGPVADSGVALPGGSRRSLADVFGVRVTDSLLRRHLTVVSLTSAIRANADVRTGVVNLAVTMPTAALARMVNERVLDGVNEFNLQTRQSQAGAERRFTEGRLKTARDDLRGAEDDLQAFLQRNRDFRNSPSLVFQHDRLQREVELRQQVYSMVQQSFEQARIDEVRDTPVITVVEVPSSPVQPDPRGLLTGLVLALLGGTFVGLVLCFFVQGFASGQETDRDALVEFRQRWAALLQDLRRPWRLLMRR